MMAAPMRSLSVIAAQTAVWAELSAARTRFRPLASLTEAIWVLAEEVDELWEAVRGDDTSHAIAEATQVAAMAARLIVEAGPRRSGDVEQDLTNAQALISALVCLSHDERPQPCASLKEGYGFLHRHFSRALKAVEEDRPEAAHNHCAGLAAATIRFIDEARSCPSSEQKAAS
ncbi:Uncharacterised protein [Mycobacteroides abscessus subsp. abscessus]|uniref:hypothetical protein n=1 Tax=Mycobacteroides abscessus TaxID=36809 RepID=UPI0009299375|nr:hypothetical protein [Mycobacteroides abscessus]SHU29087.1 Uncharacterised protein [Mycobacteroides abscessus subsp. abscessus]